MDPLASAADVAAALGLVNAAALSSTQALRLPGVLALVSRRFRMEAQRLFTPGTYTHTLRLFGGRVRLEEIPSTVFEVAVSGVDGMPQPYAVESNWIRFTNEWPDFLLNGHTATVTYAWDTPVPDDVVAAVAVIAARTLTVDPGSVIAQSKMLRTLDYTQEIANWANSGNAGIMTPDDVTLARSYRYPLPPSIVMQMGRVQ
jgi:hypothetical protein